MPLSGPQLLKHPRNVAPWGPVTNFHVANNEWRADPTHPLYRGNNNANAKYLSHPIYPGGGDPGVSTWWESWFKLDAATDVIYFIVANQPVTQIASATIQGYAIEIDGTNGRIDIERVTGGGGLTNVNTYGWAADTDLHLVRFSREVSGGNRFWRLYYGNSHDDLALVAGPTNDATYSVFQWWGWDHLTNNRCVCGGEACQS